MSSSKKELHPELATRNGCLQASSNIQVEDPMDLTSVHLEKSKVSKRKRGPIKMKNIAMDGDDRNEVKFNEKCQLIEE